MTVFPTIASNVAIRPVCPSLTLNTMCLGYCPGTSKRNSAVFHGFPVLLLTPSRSLSFFTNIPVISISVYSLLFFVVLFYSSPFDYPEVAPALRVVAVAMAYLSSLLFILVYTIEVGELFGIFLFQAEILGELGSVDSWVGCQERGE